MYCYEIHDPSSFLNITINASMKSIIWRGGIITPAKAMPRPLSLPGSALILLSAKIPSTKATGAAGIQRYTIKLTIAQTREAIARGSLCSGPVKFDWSFDGDTGGGGIGGGNEFTVEP